MPEEILWSPNSDIGIVTRQNRMTTCSSFHSWLNDLVIVIVVDTGLELRVYYYVRYSKSPRQKGGH